MSEIEQLMKSNIEIQSQLKAINKNLISLKEQSNQEIINKAISEMKKDFSYSISLYMQDNLDHELKTKINQKCSLNKDCKNLFEDMIKDNVEKIRKQEITPEYKKEIKNKLHQLRINAPKNKCRECFNGIDNLLFNHIKLLESVEEKPLNVKTEINTELDEELLINEALMPLSNKQRLEILQSLTKEDKSHSELSKITGLKGGNLIFHLEKLLKANLIIQNHERGDYKISNKGFAIMLSLNKLQDKLIEFR